MSTIPVNSTVLNLNCPSSSRNSHPPVDNLLPFDYQKQSQNLDIKVIESDKVTKVFLLQGKGVVYFFVPKLWRERICSIEHVFVR